MDFVKSQNLLMVVTMALLENSNNYNPKDNTYKKRKNFGVRNYCKLCKSIIPKEMKICTACQIEEREKNKLKKKHLRAEKYKGVLNVKLINQGINPKI